MASLNPAKPVAAFIEYTLKPLIDDATELIHLMEEKGFKKDDLRYTYRLMIWQILLDFVKSIVITGMICLTLYSILSSSHFMSL